MGNPLTAVTAQDWDGTLSVEMLAHPTLRKPIVGNPAAAGSSIAAGAAGQLSSSLFEPIDSLEPVGVPVHTNGSAAFGDDDDDVDVPPFMRH